MFGNPRRATSGLHGTRHTTSGRHGATKGSTPQRRSVFDYGVGGMLSKAKPGDLRDMAVALAVADLTMADLAANPKHELAKNPLLRNNPHVFEVWDRIVKPAIDELTIRANRGHDGASVGCAMTVDAVDADDTDTDTDTDTDDEPDTVNKPDGLSAATAMIVDGDTDTDDEFDPDAIAISVKYRPPTPHPAANRLSKGNGPSEPEPAEHVYSPGPAKYPEPFNPLSPTAAPAAALAPPAAGSIAVRRGSKVPPSFSLPATEGEKDGFESDEEAKRADKLFEKAVAAAAAAAE